jgi:hypothetical protein
VSSLIFFGIPASFFFLFIKNHKNRNYALDSDQLGPSTAAYVIGVLPGLTIIVVGWFVPY